MRCALCGRPVGAVEACRCPGVAATSRPDPLRSLLRSSHRSRADDLPALVDEAGVQLGGRRAVLHLVDYDQIALVAFRDGGADGTSGLLTVDGTLPGRAFRDMAVQVALGDVDGERTMWVPVVDGAERLGVLEVLLPPTVTVDADLERASLDVAALVAELVVTRALRGDAVERVRRRTPLTLAAELQWRLLPPLTFASPQVAVAGVLAPAAEVAGDSFDYAVNGDTAHVAIIDAMGHGLEATLLASVAISALRNCRRAGVPLVETVASIDQAIAGALGPDKFVTGVFGELDTVTGAWSWTTCGHPPALLVRQGRVVKTLDSVIGAPLGLGLLGGPAEVDVEQLEPGDRLLLYTDGVVEARDAAGDFFTTDRLVDFVVKEAAAGRPAAETLRRLNHELLRHQVGHLQDDATTVMVEWAGGAPA